MLSIKYNKLKKIRPSYLLAICFLLYIGYVGMSPLPRLFSQVKSAVHDPDSVVSKIDAAYYTMLDTQEEIPFWQNKATYIHLNGLMAKLMGQPLMNERITLSNGHLAPEPVEGPSDAEIKQTAANIIRLYQEQTQRYGYFLFIMTPTQISKYENLLPSGYSYPFNDAADQLLELLTENSVPCLDLRERMHQENILHADAFFVTDHHWTPQTGLWAYGKIIEKLADMGIIGSIQEAYVNKDNFGFKTYADCFLGSSGRRTGKYYAGMDNISFLYPKFNTKLQVSVPERNLILQGPYEDVSYNTDAGFDPESRDYFHENPYGLYGWGDTAITHWRNEAAPEALKCTMIGESFGNIPYSLMPLYFTSCDELDMRYYTDSFEEYFHSYQPDLVLLEVCAGNTVSENTQYTYFPE